MSIIDGLRRWAESDGRAGSLELAARLVLGLALVVGVYFYLTDSLPRSSSWIPTKPHPTGSVDLADQAALRVLPLRGRDQYHMRRQRELIDVLARRNVGFSITGGELDDLQTIQSLLDQRVVESDDTYALQALGIVLGDVMAKQLRLDWVSIADAYGRSRALQLPNTETLIFPVTMISRRIESRLDFTVAELYRMSAETVANSTALPNVRRSLPSDRRSDRTFAR